MSRTAAAMLPVRVLVGGLAGSVAGIHLDLWASYGYRHVPTIGTLFLLDGIAGSVLALASLTLPRRVVPLAWLAAAGFAAATLASLVVSLNTTLFGFHETIGAPLVAASITVEGTAVLVGTAAAIRTWSPQIRVSCMR